MTLSKFPPQAIAQAKVVTFADTLWQRPQVYGITIDGPTSRDLDDAIWIESTPTGAIVSVHITDAAEFVTLGSVLDQVAIARTTTRYFGEGGNDPMLPRVLSENRLSLLEWQDRPILTVKIALNHDCEMEQVEIFESWLASKKRFSYEEATMFSKTETPLSKNCCKPATLGRDCSTARDKPVEPLAASSPQVTARGLTKTATSLSPTKNAITPISSSKNS
jgi:ribonuclease R